MNKINNKFLSIFKKGDIIVLIVLVIAIILSIVFAFSGSSNMAEIYVDGDLKYQFFLDNNEEINLEDFGINVIVKVDNGTAYILSSDCKNQDCVFSTPIQKNGGMIACLPNKVVIMLTDSEVDGIV